MKIFQIQTTNIKNQNNYSFTKTTEKPIKKNKFNSDLSVINNIGLITFKGLDTSLAINRLRGFNIDEYKRLSPDFIKNLRQECSRFLPENSKEVEEQHDIVSNMIINNFNNRYGKDNWTVISLGRSLSSITKVIGYKIGEDRAKQLPMTDADRFIKPNNITKLQNSEALACLKNYLDSIGLNPQSVNNSEKHFILIDYCFTGRSLLGGYNLLTSNLLFGKNSHIHMTGIKNLISDPTIWDKLDYNLFNCKYKEYSAVKQCPSLYRTSSSIYTPDELSVASKLMQFKLLDNVMRVKE